MFNAPPFLFNKCFVPFVRGWTQPRCPCMLSTWLVVCCWCHVLSCLFSVPSHLVTQSLFQLLHLLSPSLPSFVSLFSLLVSVVLCWSVVLHCMFHVCLFCGSLPACLFFSFGVVFVYICFILLLKRQIFLHLSPPHLITPHAPWQYWFMTDLIDNVPGKWGKMKVIHNKNKIIVGHNTIILSHELYHICLILHEWK